MALENGDKARAAKAMRAMTDVSWWRWSRWLINGVTWFYTAARISTRRLDWRVRPQQIKAIPASRDSFPSSNAYAIVTRGCESLNLWD